MITVEPAWVHLKYPNESTLRNPWGAISFSYGTSHLEEDEDEK